MADAMKGLSTRGAILRNSIEWMRVCWQWRSGLGRCVHEKEADKDDSYLEFLASVADDQPTHVIEGANTFSRLPANSHSWNRLESMGRPMFVESTVVSEEVKSPYGRCSFITPGVEEVAAPNSYERLIEVALLYLTSMQGMNQLVHSRNLMLCKRPLMKTQILFAHSPRASEVEDFRDDGASQGHFYWISLKANESLICHFLCYFSWLNASHRLVIQRNSLLGTFHSSRCIS